MKTKIVFVNHASVIIKGSGISILSDPWFRGDAFNKGWRLLHQTSDEEVNQILDTVTHIWISHEHPDHFSILFFKSFSKKIKDNGIKLLFQSTKDKRVVNFLKSLGHNVMELRFNQEKILNDNFSVTCIKDGFYDSGLLIKNGTEKILNLNDCEVTTQQRADEVLNITSNIDVLLTQFSFAAWKGGKDNIKWRNEAAKEKLNTMELQINKFKPNYVIPFASFIYFSNQENKYLNDAINTPQKVLEKFKNTESNIIFMKPGDEFNPTGPELNVEDAISFWQDKYDILDTNTYTSFDEIPLPKIKESFLIYCERIRKNNSIRLIKVLRNLSPIPFFQPVIVHLSDLNQTVEVDYVSEVLIKSQKVPMITMSSESLNFIFKNPFGFDTLTVNACFEEGRKGGFVSATKTLAIENLNNMGIPISIKTLFNFSIIKLFLTRLYRVARKLDA